MAIACYRDATSVTMSANNAYDYYGLANGNLSHSSDLSSSSDSDSDSNDSGIRNTHLAAMEQMLASSKAPDLATGDLSCIFAYIFYGISFRHS